VMCVTARGGVCRGTLIGRLAGKVAARGRFAVQTGKTRRVKLRITRSATARIRRAGEGSLVLSARVPHGRVGAGRGNAELTVKLH
jgi:hypothetical protein